MMSQKQLFERCQPKSRLMGIQNSKFSKMTISLLLLSIYSLFNTISSNSSVMGQDIVIPDSYPEIFEQDVVSGNSLDDKSYAYFQMTISDRYFTGVENLAIRVISDSFESDPDLFISRINPTPTSSVDSEWYCVKKGSDTCIIRGPELVMWDILVIGVRCINRCDFTIASDYFTTMTLDQDLRSQFRLEGHSSQLFEYYVPQDANDGNAKAITFTIESENEYSPIDLYFSLDSTIYQIEERKNQNIISNGVGFYFTENDFGWCTRCFVYLYVEVTVPGRYYIRAKATARNPVIDKDKTSELFVNIRQQDCFQYFVQGEQNDLMVNLKHYQGDVEFYIAPQRIPNGPTDKDVVFINAAKAYQMQLILTAADRARIGFKTGLYEVCIFGNQDSSVAITPVEQNTGGRYSAQDSIQYTVSVPQRGAVYFTYTQSFLAQKANITVKIEGLNLNTTTNQAPPRIFYKVCASDNPINCFLSTSEANGTDKGMTPLSPTVTQGSSVRIGQINHDPKVCSKPASCYYLISVYYPDNTTLPMRTSFFVSTYLAQSQVISIDQEYRNVILQGQYFYYQLQPSNLSISGQGFSYLKSLEINVESIIGDADLVISVRKSLPVLEDSDDTNTEIAKASRQTDRFESIKLKAGNSFSLNRTIYIGIYAQTLAVYQLRFTPTYQEVTYQAKLAKAIPLNDSVPVPMQFLTEREEAFFSYAPWWSHSENRTVVITAEVIFNSIFFYTKANDFPQYYTTELQDVGDIIAIPQTNYAMTDTQYIRVRPDFALYDLISSRQYIFNFIAFSQVLTSPDNGKFIDLYCGEQQLGYVNGTPASYYRHYLIDRNSTLNVTVNPIQGNPILLIKASTDPTYPQTADPSTYDVRVDITNVGPEFFRMDPQWRYDQDISCDKAGYPLNGGNTQCTLYIAVECEGPCVYRINLQMENIQNLNVTFRGLNVPNYLTDQNYYTGQVGFNQTKYFYYPVSRSTGETVIFLNKTGGIGKNGDTKMVLSVQGDAGSPRFANQTNTFDNWFYPNSTFYRIISQTNSTNQPEIIEICNRTYDLLCGTQSCVVVIGVIGNTRNMNSNFRITAYQQKNKLYERQPLKGTIAQSGDYDYYWFSSNASFVNPNKVWEYIVAVSLDQSLTSPKNQDVDLFISAIDARYPTSEDFDFKSDNLGADSIQLRSDDPFWVQNGYSPVYGIVFVVGVKALVDNAQYQLIMTGPNRYELNYTVLQNSWVQRTFPVGNTPNNNFHVYRWFNWGQRDFRINLDIIEGATQIYMNQYSERTFINNGYLAIPVNANNSRWWAQGITSNSLNVRILKDDPNFCYYCWYYITVRTNITNAQSSYRVGVTMLPDGGEEVPYVQPGQTLSISMPSTGSTLQRRFLLDQKEPFTVSADVANGRVLMYIGLAPGQTGKWLWKADAPKGQVTSISVKTSDSNYHTGAIYYVILQAADGRVDMKLTLSQRRSVTQIQGGQVYKDRYYTAEERVKLYYFQVPRSRAFLRTTISIEALTEHFYPTVLVSKNVLTQAVDNPSQNLIYPNFTGPNFTFGDNFTQAAYNADLNFQFRDFANTSFTYFTIAVYSWSYGLTDMRKHEFKLSINVETLAAQSSNTLQIAEDDMPQAIKITSREEKNFLKIVVDEKNTFEVREIIEEEPEFLDHINAWITDKVTTIEEYLSSFLFKPTTKETQVIQ